MTRSNLSVLGVAVAACLLAGCFQDWPRLDYQEDSWHVLWAYWPSSFLREERISNASLSFDTLNRSDTIRAGRMVTLTEATTFTVLVAGNFSDLLVTADDEEIFRLGVREAPVIAEISLAAGEHRVQLDMEPLARQVPSTRANDVPSFYFEIQSNLTSW